MALTTGNVTIKLSGGTYSTWAAFWNDLGNLTGNITCTVDASAFTENTAPYSVTETLGGFTLKVTAATFPTKTDASDGPRFICNYTGTFLNMQMEGAGAVTVEGVVAIEGTSVPSAMFYLAVVTTVFTYTVRRCIAKGGAYGFRCADTDPILNMYNNIIYNQSGYAYGFYTSRAVTGYVSNNTFIDQYGSESYHGNGIYCGHAGLFENNLVYNTRDEDFAHVNTAATGNNNSSRDATADDFFAGINNRINKTTNPFTNYAADDFTLAALSDPIGNGKNLSALFTDDFFGVTRTTWDIGACEYVSAPPGLSIPVAIHHLKQMGGL